MVAGRREDRVKNDLLIAYAERSGGCFPSLACSGNSHVAVRRIYRTRATRRWVRTVLHEVFTAAVYPGLMALLFSRIVLAYDDSPESRLALDYACALARSGRQLIVAHVFYSGAILVNAAAPMGFTGIDPSPDISVLEDQGNAVLARAVDACAQQGVTAQTVVLRGAPAKSIVELGGARDADLFVVGTHGREGVARAVLGSVAEAIVRESDVPVLVVNGHARRPHAGGVFTRALVALDESETSKAPMSIAARLAASMSTHLTLCNVIESSQLPAITATYAFDPIPFHTGIHTASRKLLGESAKRNGIATADEDIIDIEGEPAEMLERTAMQCNCDVIILGTHARRGVKRFILGSVAETVARRSSVPVLIVPARDHAP